ncbi:phosphonate metabolism transcriptional regulator PhnF [Raineyella sp. LH-20]|uniref:phosphonate metabolism transcriptional regulator PhnF n=1 Tax=Raineyella sp. LH-20 TaxID=3081204 RepID=UPI002955C5EF|nr:phosphonate metabolism transcriptional regulator PhnF [Raineyella sp. LH-20]WOP18796.1 phosphonate metabolism transcriptional regulator PhnF [Raineyella sp. LH-20]
MTSSDPSTATEAAAGGMTTPLIGGNHAVSSGYQAWRLIAEELRGEILDGHVAVGAKLASEGELAERFGVNRHTVRRAVAALAADGLVVARRGSGTYVNEHAVLVHRIGMRTRLTDSLGAGVTVGMRLLGAGPETPPAEVASRLQIDGREALRLDNVRTVDGRPVLRGTQWLAIDFAPAFLEKYRRTGSVTAGLRAGGIDDYLRASTTVGARHATAAEAADLELTVGAVVLVVRALDVLPDGTPLLLGITRFAAQWVELDIEHGGS